MKTLTFKTNIKCSGCVAKVTPFLNDATGVESWEVNTEDSDKILTVTTNTLTAEQVKEVVVQSGFQAESILLNH